MMAVTTGVDVGAGEGVTDDAAAGAHAASMHSSPPNASSFFTAFYARLLRKTCLASRSAKKRLSEKLLIALPDAAAAPRSLLPCGNHENLPPLNGMGVGDAICLG